MVPRDLIVITCVMLGCDRPSDRADNAQRTLSGNLIGRTTLADAIAGIERDGDHCTPGTRDELGRVHAADASAASVQVCVGGRLLHGRRLVMAAADRGAPITVYGVYETEPDLHVATKHIAEYVNVFVSLHDPRHLAVAEPKGSVTLAPGVDVRREWSYDDLSVKVWAIARGADGFDIGYRYIATTN